MVVDCPNEYYKMNSPYFTSTCFIYWAVNSGGVRSLFMGCQNENNSVVEIEAGSAADKWKIKDNTTGLYWNPVSSPTFGKYITLASTEFEFTATPIAC